jgi:hypothetical protein
MATVDNLTVKVSVEGVNDLNNFNENLKNIDKSTKSASDSLKAFNARNVAYQIQDLAVQIAGGTSAFVAFGQQLPQLLGGFGVAGAVIGAVAAVAIPLLKIGLETLGYDFRNLNQRLNDLNSSSQAFIQAQQANLASVEGLRAGFGGLASASKEFFQLQQAFTQQKALLELNSGVNELQDNLRNLNPDIAKMRDSLGLFSGPVEGVARLQQAFKLWQLGLTAEQAAELSKQIRQLDPSNPEQVAKQVTVLLETLKEAGVPADKLRAVFEQIVEPALKIGNASLDLNKNIKAAGEEASALQVALLGIQSKYQPDANAARRNFNQIKAIQLEGQQKIEEYIKQSNERSSKDGVDRTKEITAFKIRTNQDVSDKVAEIRRQQEETALAAEQTLLAKNKQLAVEDSILKLNEDGKLAALNAFQYNADNLKIQADYQIELKAIDEQLRKNLITQQQAFNLQQLALKNKQDGERNAYDALDARQQNYIKGLERANELDQRKLDNFKKGDTISFNGTFVEQSKYLLNPNLTSISYWSGECPPLMFDVKLDSIKKIK